MTVLKPIRHEDRLSVIDHLDELRKRIFVSGGTLLAAFIGCFVVNHPLIKALNRPLPKPPKSGIGAVPSEDARFRADLTKAAHATSQLSHALAHSHTVIPGAAQATNQMYAFLLAAGKVFPVAASPQEKPAVFGPTEAFTTTLMVCGYFAVIITLPVLLYQLYAFVIPALSKTERKVAVPSMIAAPVLFVVGVVFSYFAILPPAIHFLQTYNSNEFQFVLQASPFYKFEIMLMGGIGLAFEVPLLLLALQKAGLITAGTLTLNWRYATVIIAVIAAALPGVDPVTMTLETLPLILLYLASIVLLKFVERRNRRRVLAEAQRAVDGSDS